MKYLFFDLEYATSKGRNIKICEFGYVVTNERFEIIKKGNFIIDPYINRCDWDWRVVKKILTRKVKEYESMPRFDEYYFDCVFRRIQATYLGECRPFISAIVGHFRKLY